MDNILKSLTMGIGGVINVATATLSPYKVQLVDYESYKR